MDGQAQFQNVLLKKLSEIQSKNPSYSMRSFARRVDLSPSAVSEILRGRRNVSVKKMKEVLGRLHLSPSEIGQLTMSKTAGSQLLAPSAEYRKLSADQYFAISDSHYFAILSLIDTKSFQGQQEEICRRLGLSRSFVAQAIERLERLKLLKIQKGKIVSLGGNVTTTDDVKDLALQKAQRQNLEMALEALETQSVEERDFISLTLAMDPADVPAVKKRVRDFLLALNNEFEGRNKKKVYKTNVQFFSLEKETL